MGMQVIKERNSIRGSHQRTQLPTMEPAVDPPSYIRTVHPQVEDESWMVDESWTAIVGYMAELALPGEG